MLLQFTFLLLACVCTALTQPIAFDNTVEDEPTIDCHHNQIRLNVKTAKQRPSYIFAKGHFGKQGCSFGQTNNATFNLNGCNMLRKREVGPKGLSYSMTVIVQLHPLFITKVDRAYNVRCFYMEADKSISNGITRSVSGISGIELNRDYSDLSTQMINGNMELPTCKYTLHKESPNGAIARYSMVGDVLYHVWECASEHYAMLVHDCHILDGQGKEHAVIDSSGCSTDLVLMPELSYSDDRTRTFTASNAFNFPDQPTVYFNCKIQLCARGDENCGAITPPKCGIENSKDNTLLEELNTDQLIQSTKRASDSTANRTPTTAPPKTTTTEDFPSPKEFVLEEGSGHEESLVIAESTTTAFSTTTSEPIVTVSTSTVKGKRPQRHTKTAERPLDFDVTSSQVTILDDNFVHLESPASSSQQALSAAEFAAHKDRVCIPHTLIWVFVALSVSSIAIFAIIFFYSRRCARKSYSY